MKKFFILLLCLYSFSSLAQQTEEIKTYHLPTIEIVSKKTIPIVDKYSYSTDYNSYILNKNGFTLIRRGMNFTQDLYVEGFRKGDIKVLVDGEQYHNACPNRMDAPATRLNIINMSYVELTKSASLLGTGIYGKVEYHRAELNKPFKLKSLLNKNFGASNDYDASFSTEGLFSNLSLRYSSGTPYQNAKGKSFKDLYGYKENFRYSYLNSSLRHKLNEYDIEFGGGFLQAKDISFPYLQMDERSSKVFNGYVSYKKNKIYFNYTDHLMNNGLRSNYYTMQMETDAKNLTVGMKGEFYELLYRNWNANNFIRNPMTGLLVSNKLMPNVDQVGLNVSQDYNFGKFQSFVKGGVQYFRFKDISIEQFYKELYSDISKNRFFISAGLIGNYSTRIFDNLILSTTAELATDAPDAEQLFIAVKRPMTNPDWSGNPNLNQPVKTSFRTSLNYKFIGFELFGNYIANYVEVVKKMKTPTKPSMTYDNINAIIAGANLTFSYEWIESNISYLWGENVKNKMPISEISPLSINSVVRFPEFYGVSLSINHRYENAQKRVNKDLKEFSTPSWNSIGFSIRYSIDFITFDLQVNNILNHNYIRYLSYSRSPFSAGIPIYEPGRTIGLTIFMDKELF